MRTEKLIEHLASDLQPRQSTERAALAALAVGLAIAGALLLWLLGLRPDLGAAMTDPIVAPKTLLPLALASAALPLGLRLARPDGTPGPALIAIAWIALAAPALFLIAWVTTSEGDRLPMFLGHSIGTCLPSITLLALPVLAALLWALRRSAPWAPGRCGAVAGLVAGGIAAGLYSLFCIEDSPLFYAVWYSAGIGIVAAIGALAGARYLRW